MAGERAVGCCWFVGWGRSAALKLRQQDHLKFDQISSNYSCTDVRRGNLPWNKIWSFFLSTNHMTVGIVQTGKRWWGETLQLNSQTFEADMFFFLYFQKCFWKSTSSPILSCFRWSLLWKVPTPGWWWNGRWMSSLMYSEELNHCLQIFMMFKWKYMHACMHPYMHT